MKKSILLAGFLLLPVLLLANGYNITGNIKNADGQKVIMYRGDYLTKLQAIDSAEVKNGQFTLAGKFAEPELVFLRFFKDSNRGIYSERGIIKRPCIPLFIGNDKVKVTAVLDSLPQDYEVMYYHTFDINKFSVTGSAINDAYLQYVNGYTAEYEKLQKIGRAFYDYVKKQGGKVSPMVRVNEARKVMKLRQQRTDFQKQYILSHANDYSGLLALDQGMSLLSKSQLQDVVAALSAKMKATPYGKRLLAKADTVMATAKGSQFVDYPIEMADGSSKHLSDFLGKGNYTLLEFWASWCRPCRGSIPHLKQLYGLYHPQGFNILSVSVDQDKKAWHKAMKEENMKWDLAIPKGNPREISRLYNFDGIPYCILIDPKGYIVDINTRDEFLDSYLTDIYGQKLDKFTICGQLTDVNDTLFVSYSTANEFPMTRKTLAPIVVDKDGKFSATYNIDTPGYFLMYEPIAKQKEKGNNNVLTLWGPAVPGEFVKVEGTTKKPKYSGSNLYEEYGEAYAFLKAKPDSQSEANYTKLANDLIQLRTKNAKTKNKKLRSANQKAMEQIEKQLRERQAQQVSQLRSRTLAYIKSHPRQEVTTVMLQNVEADSLESAIKSLNYFVTHGRMVPYIEAARSRVKKTQAMKEAKKAIKEGALAPDWTLKTPEGKDLSLKDLRGKYVLLDFWGSWCGWCVKGIPDMKKFYAKHKDKVEFVSIDCNDTEEKWKNALEKYQMPWRHVKNNATDGVPEKYAVNGYPTKILVDAEGKIAFIFEGEDPVFYKKLAEKLK
jgi:thiol-disulfide isomerase/thioredoxin/ElaB/YqjD/DUF883 family membrane-anchored ribosome-binding protein